MLFQWIEWESLNKNAFKCKFCSPSIKFYLLKCYFFILYNWISKFKQFEHFVINTSLSISCNAMHYRHTCNTIEFYTISLCWLLYVEKFYYIKFVNWILFEEKHIFTLEN